MDIQTAIRISPVELEAIIKQFLAVQGYAVESIDFELDSSDGNVKIGNCHVMCIPKPNSEES